MNIATASAMLKIVCRSVIWDNMTERDINKLRGRAGRRRLCGRRRLGVAGYGQGVAGGLVRWSEHRL